MNASAFRAVVERPHLWKVTVNGKPVSARSGEWWLDRAFGVYDIGANVAPGRNTIRLTARPMSIHHEVEPVYVLGEFALDAQPRGWKIVRPRFPAPGSWKEQGLPFYSSAVSYARIYRLKKGAFKVKLGNWHGIVAEVTVNGKPAGIIGWKPYELDVSRLVRDGENVVVVTVVGSLKNLLGPHHGKISRGFVSPWNFRNASEHMPPGVGYDLDSYGLFGDIELIESRSR